MCEATLWGSGRMIGYLTLPRARPWSNQTVEVRVSTNRQTRSFMLCPRQGSRRRHRGTDRVSQMHPVMGILGILFRSVWSDKSERFARTFMRFLRSPHRMASWARAKYPLTLSISAYFIHLRENTLADLISWSNEGESLRRKHQIKPPFPLGAGHPGALGAAPSFF